VAFGQFGTCPIVIWINDRTATSGLVLTGSPFSVGKKLLVLSCDLFENRPGLLETAYEIRSRVSTGSFTMFLSALENKRLP
jgi:hypothetical protein